MLTMEMGYSQELMAPQYDDNIAGGGLYSFVVCPGNYLVEIAASNFNREDHSMTMPHVCPHQQSDGGAVDPDNDVNTTIMVIL